MISIHALLAESDDENNPVFAVTSISIHALLAESDFARFGRLQIIYNFYPRSPCGERHDTSSLMVCQAKFLSTLSLRRATRRPGLFFQYFCISIHALLAESDIDTSKDVIKTTNFYPRSPCGERLLQYWAFSTKLAFLSTLSLRRATYPLRQLQFALRYFYPRSPCGERLSSMLYDTTSLIFLSTLSLRRATFSSCRPDEPSGISIHALLAESDVGFGWNNNAGSIFLSTLSLRRATGFGLARLAPSAYFYPRSPCGERLPNSLAWVLARLFLSTLSLRRATFLVAAGYRPQGISIHALLAESDLMIAAVSTGWTSFLSTLSLRRATAFAVYNPPGGVISIHALLAESDWVWMGGLSCDGNFYPRSPCGERPGYQRPCERPTTDFYPRSPCGERPFKIGVNLTDRKHFYPRSPCGERLYPVRGQRPNWRISIHALLAESDKHS